MWHYNVFAFCLVLEFYKKFCCELISLTLPLISHNRAKHSHNHMYLLYQNIILFYIISDFTSFPDNSMFISQLEA